MKMIPLSEDEVKVQKNERRERREKNIKAHLHNQEECVREPKWERSSTIHYMNKVSIYYCYSSRLFHSFTHF